MIRRISLIRKLIIPLSLSLSFPSHLLPSNIAVYISRLPSVISQQSSPRNPLPLLSTHLAQFTTSLTTGTYLLAALYTNNDTDAWTARLGGGGWWRRGSDLPTDEEMRRAKRGDLGKVSLGSESEMTICVKGERWADEGGCFALQRLQEGLNSLVKTISGWPESVQVPLTRVYITLSEAYLHTPSAQLASLGIIGLNALVFLAWRVPRWGDKMSRYFMHWPVGPNHRVITLATSVFSHQSLAHFAFNSIALYSFGSAAYTWLSRPNVKDIDAVS